MNPFDYLLQYRQLKVPLVSGTTLFGIDVHEYRNAQDVFDARNTDKDPTNDVDNMRADFDAGPGWTNGWGPLRGRIAAHGESLGKNRYRLRFPLPTKQNPTPAVTAEEIVNTVELARAFTGKGTPEICAQALRLAEAFGLVRPTVAALQSYCDDYIGLDCNGFVGNYLKLRGCQIVGPETPAYPYAFIPPAYRMTSLEEVRVESVLCWKTAGHVAIIDYIDGPLHYQIPSQPDAWVLRCSVCEATGARREAGNVHTDGLNRTTYIIYPPGRDRVFKVKRTAFGDALNDVYIGNLLETSPSADPWWLPADSDKRTLKRAKGWRV